MATKRSSYCPTVLRNQKLRRKILKNWMYISKKEPLPDGTGTSGIQRRTWQSQDSDLQEGHQLASAGNLERSSDAGTGSTKKKMELGTTCCYWNQMPHSK